MNNGFIQLHRKLLEWEWYTDQKTFRLFLHCLLKANHKEQNWRGQTIKRGQFITSLQHLSNETGLSVKQVRTALSNLIKTGELGKQSTSINTLITVTCYDKYQSKGKPKANEGQTEGKQRATNNNDNKENNEINIPFSKFWNLYGKKKGNRSSCEKKWNRLKDSEREEIIETLPNFKKSVSDIKYLPYPETYLNGRRWEDVIEQPEPKRATGQFRDHLC